MQGDHDGKAEIVPEDIGTEILGSIETVSERTQQICGHSLSLIVEKATAKCPREEACYTSLTIAGDIPRISIYSADSSPKVKVEGDVITFGKTTMEFRDECREIVVSGTRYALGTPGAGFDYQFSDGSLTAAQRAPVPA